MIARFLDRYWPWLLGLIAALLTVGYVVVLNGRINTLTAERDKERIKVTAITGSLERQNAGIAAMAAAAEANREVYLAGLAAANRRAIRLEIEAEDILAMPSPPTQPEQCEEARELLIGGAE